MAPLETMPNMPSQEEIHVENPPVDELRWDAVGMIGRSREIEQVEQALASVLETKKASSLLIHGYSGTGKSALALHVIQRFDVLSVKGKYDQNSGSRPFSAVIDATTELLDALEYEKTERIVESLKVEEQQILGMLVPAFSILSGCESSHYEDSSKGNDIGPDESTLIRFMGIFRRFLIAVCNELPLVLFLDDLQWADEASRSLLDSIFRDRRMSNLLLVGAIRDGEPTTFDPPVRSILPVLKLTIGPLTLESSNDVCSKALNMKPEKTEELSKSVLKATVGNPYFVKQFITSLHRTKLVQFSPEKNEFVWDIEKVQEHAQQSDNVVELMVKTIKAMSYQSQIILVVAATMGHTFKASVLSPVLGTFDLLCLLTSHFGHSQSGGSLSKFKLTFLNEEEVMQALDEACKAGLIEMTKIGVYRFTHDRVQQSATMLLPEGDVGRQIKAKLGSLLLKMSSGHKDSWMLFAGTDLLMKNAPPEEASQVAAVCVKAAKTASKQGAFKTAARFSDFGYSLIAKKMRTNYKVGIELLTLAAEMHYCGGAIDTAKERVESVCNKAISTQDRFRANHVLLQCLSNESDYDASVSNGIDMINETGIHFPKHPGKLAVARNLIALKSKLRGKKARDLYALPKMRNRHMEEALNLLSIIGFAAFFGGLRDTTVLVLIKMTLITLDHGISRHAPSAIACYAMLESHLGNMQKAYDYAMVASELSKRRSMEPQYCRTRIIVAVFHHYLGERFHTSVADLAKGVDLGLKHADSMQAFVAMRQVSQFNIFAGKTLFYSEKNAAVCRETMVEYKQFGQIVTGEPFLQLITYMRSESADPSLLTGIYVDEDGNDYRETSPPAMNKSVDLNAHQVRMILHYLVGEHEIGEADRKKHAHLEQEPSTTYIKFFYFTFCALNFFAIAAKTGRKRAPGARTFVNIIKSYGKANGPDVIDMINLLKAEKAALDNRKVDKAKDLYNKAILGFAEGKFYLMEAIAYERLGLALHRAKDANGCKTALLTSLSRFETYGATLKVNQLRKTYPCLFKTEQVTM